MKRLLWIIPLVVIILAAAWVAKEFYSAYKGYQTSLLLVIPPGTRAPEVAALLTSRGVLASRVPFLLRYWIGRRHHETIKSGEYQFRRPLTPLQVYEKLIRGEVYLHTIVIPEGSDRLDIALIFQREIGLNARAFLAATANSAAVRDLDPQAPSLEGYLFPDTYRFPRDAPASKVVAVMLARFREVLNSQFHEDLPAGSRGLHDVITLASLVEKETPDANERPMIAGVFTRRLQKGMPLDCDPTVTYAVELSRNFAGPFNGPITRSELETPSPYNTYAHTGLPPGPICSPGAASIRAALHPAAGEALYFVSNNHGGHVFANTLAEHHRNVERYEKELQMQQHAPQRQPVPARPHL